MKHSLTTLAIASFLSLTTPNSLSNTCNNELTAQPAGPEFRNQTEVVDPIYRVPINNGPSKGDVIGFTLLSGFCLTAAYADLRRRGFL